MAKHPFQGITGTKQRKELPGERLPRDENQELSRQYIASRNKKLALAIEREEQDLQVKKGELISKRLLAFQVGFLLTGLRERILRLPHTLPRQLQDKSEHQMAAIIKTEVHQMLSDLADWPRQIADPDWVKHIDKDLMPSKEEEANSGNA